MEKTDSRKADRKVIQVWAREMDQGDIRYHLVSNISPKGLFIQKKLPLAIGSVLALEIDIPNSDETLTLKGRVIDNYQDQGHNLKGTGVKFLGMGQEQNAKLSILISFFGNEGTKA